MDKKLIVDLLATASTRQQLITMAVELIVGQHVTQAEISQRIRRIEDRRFNASSVDKDGMRDRCISAFAMTCQYCSVEGGQFHGPDGHPWELDRIKPGKHGGAYKADNVTLACHVCNIKKGHKVIFKKPKSLSEALS